MVVVTSDVISVNILSCTTLSEDAYVREDGFPTMLDPQYQLLHRSDARCGVVFPLVLEILHMDGAL